MRTNLVFAAMIGSAKLGWLFAPVAVVCILAGHSFFVKVGAAAVFAAVGNVQAFALATMFVCAFDPPSALILVPAVVADSWSPFLARCGILAAAAVKIWWQGTAAPVQTEARLRTP